FRLSPNFERLSTVRSITDFERIEGQYDVIAKRTDWDYGKSEGLSRTRLIPDAPGRHGLFFYPTRMRGETVLYGGEKSGLVAANGAFTKVPGISTDKEMLDCLTKIFVFNDTALRWESVSRETTAADVAIEARPAIT
ncbi:MAG TPA: hypothetical protein VEW25_00935, partial [Allosphingosinicella sp.]|nr:hypothetical protein [Allosphingosinicella sp.]